MHDVVLYICMCILLAMVIFAACISYFYLVYKNLEYGLYVYIYTSLYMYIALLCLFPLTIRISVSDINV